MLEINDLLECFNVTHTLKQEHVNNYFVVLFLTLIINNTLHHIYVSFFSFSFTLYLMSNVIILETTSKLRTKVKIKTKN